MNFFNASRIAMARVIAWMQRDQDIPVAIAGTADRKNYRRTDAWEPTFDAQERRRVVLNPSLAPARKRRVRPGVKSLIFRP